MLKRPMLFITVCYIIGIILGLYLGLNIALFVLVFSVLTSIVIVILAHSKKLKKVLLITMLCIITISISTIRTSYLENKFDKLYSDFYMQNTVEVGYTAQIVSIEKESQYYYNYIIKIINIDNNTKYRNTNILLKAKKNKNNVIQLKYGDIITGKMSLEKPEIQRN